MAVVGSGDQGLQIVIDPTEWYRLKAELDKFDPALAKALRRRIRNAGNVAAEEVRKTLRLPPPSGGPDNTGGREALIAATKVTVSFAKRAAGAKIVTSSRGLDAAHKGLVNVYNKTQFRHPVYGRAVWVAQQGRPYFGASINKAISARVVQEVWDALDEATRAIGARAS
ncbi:MAG: hypothetical protein ABJB03_00535 [Rhodoglobus sp.]